MKSIVLAAGKGTRMLSLTKDTSKVLIPVCGKPFLWYVLKNLYDAGISEIGLVVGWKKENVKLFVKDFQKGFPIKITFIEQKDQLGTAHATLLAKNFVGNDDFISINADNLYSSEDLKNLKAFDVNCVAAIEVSDPQHYGVLDCKGDILKRIVEKPKDPPSNLVNAAAYRFTPEIFTAIEKAGKNQSGEFYITDAINILAANDKVKVYRIGGYWLDFGKPEDIPKVERFLQLHKDG